MSTEQRHARVVNLIDLEGQQISKGNRFAAVSKGLGRSTGARGVGCTWFEVPPGRTAFPLHFHCANEEALFILEGEGTLRIGAEKVPLRPHDYVTLPPGPDFAHQLVNTGDKPLRYLALSTLSHVEVVGYPDSGKIGASAVPALGERPWVRALFKSATQVEYYEGESTD